MIRQYSHGSINEHEEPVTKLQEAIDAVMKKGFFKDIDYDRSGIYTYDDGWTVAKIYSTHNDKDDLDNKLMVYSYEKGDVLNKEPIREIFWNKDMKDHVIAEKRMEADDIMNRYRNFMDRDGITLSDWLYYINPEAVDKDGYHIVLIKDDNHIDNVNMMNKEGKLRFDTDVHEIERCGDYFTVVLRSGSTFTANVYNGHGEVVLENCPKFNNIELMFRNPDKTIQIYFTDCKRGAYYDFYDSDLNMIAEGVDYKLSQNAERSDILKLLTYARYRGKSLEFVNIVARDGKLLFESPVSNVKNWATNMSNLGFPEYGLYQFDRDDKHIIFDCVSCKLIDNIWYDKIKFTYVEPFSQDLILVSKDGKCNMIMCKAEGLNRSFETVFKKPVDNIKKYDKIPFLFVTKDDQDYILWKDNKMMSVPVEKLYRTGSYATYVYSNDDKFDLVNIYNDKTFCEMFMNGEKFDACFDAECDYPLMEKSGKLTFINADLFRPAFTRKGIKGLRWFDDADPLDDDRKPYQFNVVEDGVDKILYEDGKEKTQ